MAFLDFLKKEVECTRCGTLVLKKLSGKVYSTHQGRLKDGDIQMICNECLLNSMTDYFINFSEKAVIVYPSAKYNACVFYQVKYMKDQNSKNHDTIVFLDGIKSLLPPAETTCASCKEIAQYSWCCMDMYPNADPFNWYFNEDGDPECKYLCKACLVSSFRSTVVENDIIIEFVMPLYVGEGLCSPWQV